MVKVAVVAVRAVATAFPAKTFVLVAFVVVPLVTKRFVVEAVPLTSRLKFGVAVLIPTVPSFLTMNKLEPLMLLTENAFEVEAFETPKAVTVPVLITPGAYNNAEPPKTSPDI